MAEKIVLKYGGMSLATPGHIKSAAKQVAELVVQGNEVVAVVSAMGKTTDQLQNLAYQVSHKPNRRELDMLLSTGERVSMSLFSMALNEALIGLGSKNRSISFTGSQAGILTDLNHSNAKILSVTGDRIRKELALGNPVILAGFQGVDPISKEITTLGRGGTDVTAMALAIHTGADRCVILKEVPGVMSADPKLVPQAKLIEELSLEAFCEMTFWGAKVTHYRATELALTHRKTIEVRLAHPDSKADRRCTIIKSLENKGAKPVASYEKTSVLAVSSHAKVKILKLQTPSLTNFNQWLQAQTLPDPQVLEFDLQKQEALLTGPSEILSSIEKSLEAADSPAKFLKDDLATVTVTCTNSVASSLAAELMTKLQAAKVVTRKVLFSPLSITFLIECRDLETSVKALA